MDEQICSPRSNSVGPNQSRTGTSGCLSGLADLANLSDLDNDISEKCDFYRTHDIRPPFTYAALIRQVIIHL